MNASMKENMETLAELNPAAVTADGFDDAYIGYVEDGDGLQLACYSVSKSLEILMKDMDLEEATEYFEFNVSGAYVGDGTPIWLYD